MVSSNSLGWTVTDKGRERHHGDEYALALLPIPGMGGSMELKMCRLVEVLQRFEMCLGIGC